MLKINNADVKNIILLTVLSCVFFMAVAGVLSLTNPDEVFYAQTAKEMAERGSWMTPYLFGAPQFEKPILTYWLLRLGFIMFGVTSFGARFFPAVWGVLGVLAVYGFGAIGFGDRKKAFLSAFIMMSSGLYFGLARTVFTDLFFSVFILGSMASFFLAYARPEKKALGFILFYVFAALAVLTKGPLGILLPLLTVLAFLSFRRELKFFLCGFSFWGFLLFCALAVPWYATMIARYGREFIQEFFVNDHIRRLLEAEHLANDRWYFYPLSALGCMFPWTFFVLFAFVRFIRRLRKSPSAFELFLACWIGVVFVVFQAAHSKLVSYIFPFFPAMALLGADYIAESLSARRRLFSVAMFLTWAVLVLLPLGLFIAARFYAAYIPSVTPIFAFGSVFAIYLAAMLFFFLKNRRETGVYMLGPVLLLLLGFAFSRTPDFEAYVSSRPACRYLVSHHSPSGVILATKFFARGVRYYTGYDVAVLDISGKGFFSPHPIPYLKTHEELHDFLAKQDVTYALLKPSYGKDVQRIVGPRFSAEVLKIIGDVYILRITRL